ncbi:MAG: heavy metal translocating P-type ATPase [Thermofilaceae archaeon]
MVRERVKVLGVDCPTCVLSIQRELSKLGAQIEIDASTGDAVVVYDSSRVTLRDIVRAVRAAGYDVEKRSLTLSVELSEEEASKFESSVSRLKGVVECRYSPVTGLAKVAYNPYTVSEEEILSAVRELGYRAEVRVGEVEHAEGRGGQPWVPLISFALGLTAVTYHFLEAFELLPHAPAALYGALASIVLLLNAKLVWRGFRALTRLSPTMDSLIALSSTVAYASSIAFASTGHGAGFFEAAAGVLGFVSAGKYLEERLRKRALKALSELAALQSGRARVVRNGSVVEVDVGQLKVGDLVEVRAGERIPVDGVVVEGWGYVDESAFTGEPVPRFKTAEKRDPVLAGTLLTSGFLRVSATRVGGDTTLAHIIEIVREAQFRKPGFQRVADRIVGLLTWVVMALSLVTFAYWLAAGEGIERAALFAASVLAVTCPCPLGIAVPLAVAVASMMAARSGILIRGGDVFERVRRVDTVVFDKTGTLTVGAPRVSSIYPLNGFSEELLLRLAGSAERRSEHPLAKAILERCREAGVEPPEPQSFEHVPGMGVIAEVESVRVAVGSERLIEGATGAALDGEARRLAEEVRSRGSTALFVAVDGRLAGVVEVRDEVRGEAKRVVARLREMGLRTVLATGDSWASGKWVARELGLDEVRAELPPEDKAELVEDLQRRGARVMFVGDGVNDAPALGKAFVGVAVGSGAEIAREAGDVVLVSKGLDALVHLLDLGRRVERKALENLAWAFIYNIALVPIAMGLLYHQYGLMLRPEMAAAAMMLSDISVVLNALSLLKWKPEPLT